MRTTDDVMALVQEHARAQWARIELAGDRAAEAALQEKRALAKLRDAYTDGARGRGSLARYRRAVVSRLDVVEDVATDWRRRIPPPSSHGVTYVPYVDSLGHHHVVDVRRAAAWWRRAEARLRRILAALDGVRS